jgi:linoleoyl-CoA desaturase
MRTIKFISTDYNQKKFVIALRKNVNDYFKMNGISTKGNIFMYIKAIVMLSIYIIPFSVILLVPITTIVAILLVILMGIGEGGIGMSVMHDAAHGAFSRNKHINNIFASTMFILGSNTFNWKVQHNILHHTFTNIYGYDQDIETKAVLRLSEHAPKKKFHKFQYIYAFFFYGLMTISKLITDIFQLIEFNKTGITKEQNHNPKIELIRLLLSKVLYFSIIIGLPILLTQFKWWQVLIGFSILHFTAGIIMSTIFQMAHVVKDVQQPLPNEEGIIPHEWIVHQLMTTADFAKNNKFLNWYVGGLNFQVEHHLFPNICHIHYPKIAPIVEKTTLDFGIAYHKKKTFLSALKSHIKRLKELG